MGRVNRSGPVPSFGAVPWNRSAVLWSGPGGFFRRFQGSGNFFPTGSRFRGSEPVASIPIPGSVSSGSTPVRFRVTCSVAITSANDWIDCFLIKPNKYFTVCHFVAVVDKVKRKS